MNYKRTIARLTGNYRAIDKKALTMKKSWDEVEKLLSKTGPAKRKKTEDKNKK